ncbi:MAG TPA: hypothetical protein DEG44_02970 [Candidatus Kerfeldbacteria bacterium]|nr:hypothetical protein [Candidatus Kerfeldbacteria bacterium]
MIMLLKLVWPSVLGLLVSVSVSHLTVSDIGARSATLHWEATTNTDHYRVTVSKTNGDLVKKFSVETGSKLKLKSRHLISNQGYTFKVQACQSDDSCSPSSKRKSFRTNPARVGSLTITATTSDAATVQISSKPRGTINSYQIKVRQAGSVIQTITKTTKTDQASPSYTITNLEGNTTYSITIRAKYNSTSVGSYSRPVEFTTDQPLSVTSSSPSSSYTDLEPTLEIVGTAFQDGATTMLDDMAANTTTVNSATSITALFDDGLATGTYTVTVTNPDSTSATLEDALTISNPPDEWSKETLSFSGSPRPLTSTCTILMPDNSTYRMYYIGSGGVWSTVSSDGITWSSPVTTTISDSGVQNPSVLRLAGGTYLMIYGVQTTEPMTERLFRATSTDGITFTEQTGSLTGGVVLLAESDEDDFVSVPELIQLADGSIRMYFVASTTNSNVHTAVSTDNGATWTREGQIDISGGPTGGQINDPDVVELADGTYRLFFTTPPADQSIGDLRIRSAISTDGRSFTLESGSRVIPATTVNALMDPDTILLKDTTDQYRLYYGGNLTAGGADDLRALFSQ